MFEFRKRTWIIGGVVATLIATGAVASRIHGRSVEDRVDFATYMITRKLELNDTQEASLDKLAASWVATAGTMKSFRKSMIDEVKGLASGEDLSVEQLNALRDKVKAEIDRRTNQLVPEMVAFYNGLDQNQRARITSRLDKMSERMEKGDFSHRRGRRHHHWQEND